MTDYTDLIARLREGRTTGSHLRWTVTDIHREAADAIAALQEVLSFYASESLWDHDGGLDGLTPMERDCGQKARSLLYGRAMRLVQQTTGDVTQADKG